MIKLFGSNYEEFGSSETNLILKTKGKIKIQWGNKFIDLLDNNGNVGGAKTSDLIKKVSSTEQITEDGIYFQSSSKSENTVSTNIGPVSSSRRAAAVVASVDGEQIDLTKQSDWNQSDSSQIDFIRNKPTKLSDFINDVGFLTSHQSLTQYALKSELPQFTQVQADWDQTDSSSPDYIKNKPSLTISGGGNEISLEGYATETWVGQQGFLTSSDLSTYALKTELFSGSYNDLTDKPSLFSGNYNDLTNKPTIPSLTGYATETWVENKGYLTSHQDLSSYALKSELFSGSYDDLTNKPTIPDNTVYVDLSNAQTISGNKTFSGTTTFSGQLNTVVFTGRNPIKMKSPSNNTTGFTFFNSSDSEKGYVQYNQTKNSLFFGKWHSDAKTGFLNETTSNTVEEIYIPNVGSTGVWYVPISITDGTNTVTANSSGSINISTLLPTEVNLSNYVQISNTSGLIKNDGTIDTSTYGKIWTGTQAQYEALSPNYDANTMYVINDPNNSPVIPQIWQGTQAQYDALSPNYDNNTIYIITAS